MIMVKVYKLLNITGHEVGTDLNYDSFVFGMYHNIISWIWLVITSCAFI